MTETRKYQLDVKIRQHTAFMLSQHSRFKTALSRGEMSKKSFDAAMKSLWAKMDELLLKVQEKEEDIRVLRGVPVGYHDIITWHPTIIQEDKPKNP